MALLGLAVAVGPVRAEELRGRVVGLADGDTATVIGTDKAQHRVRIAGIDAPEPGQPGAQRSKESLAALVHDQPVRVEWSKRAGFDGIVGKIWVASPDSPCRGKPDCPMTVDVGLVQITIGRAWWSRRHADEQSPEDRSSYESSLAASYDIVTAARAPRFSTRSMTVTGPALQRALARPSADCVEMPGSSRP